MIGHPAPPSFSPVERILFGIGFFCGTLNLVIRYWGITIFDYSAYAEAAGASGVAFQQLLAWVESALFSAAMVAIGIALYIFIAIRDAVRRANGAEPVLTRQWHITLIVILAASALWFHSLLFGTELLASRQLWTAPQEDYAIKAVMGGVIAFVMITLTVMIATAPTATRQILEQTGTIHPS